MRFMNLSHIKHVKWDWEGVFYDYDTPYMTSEELFAVQNAEKAKAACEIFNALDYKKALELSYISYQKYNDAIQAFIPLAKGSNLDEGLAKLELFHLYHKKIFEVTPQEFPQIFMPEQKLINEFERTKSQISHSVVTHSCVNEWAKPSASKKEIEQYIGHWIGYNHFDFLSKSQSQRALDVAFEMTGAKPEETAFVEDSIKHLEVSKNAYPDMVTVFKGNLNGEPKPDYVDVVVNKPVDFLKKLAV